MSKLRKVYGSCEDCSFKGEFKKFGICPNCASTKVKCRKETYQKLVQRLYPDNEKQPSGLPDQRIFDLERQIKRMRMIEIVHEEMIEIVKKQMSPEEFFELTEKAENNADKVRKKKIVASWKRRKEK